MDGRIVILLILFALFVLTLLLGIKESISAKAKILDRVKSEYGKKRKANDNTVKLLSHHIDGLGCSYHLDNITMGDIDIQKIFSVINHTRSSIGQEYLLYQMMRGRLPKNELQDFESLVSYFTEDADMRYSLLAEYEELGKNSKADIDRYFHNTKRKEAGAYGGHIFIYVLYTISIVLLFVSTGLGIVVLFFSLFFGILKYFKDKTRMALFLDSAFYLIRLIEAGKRVEVIGKAATNQRLKELSGNIKDINGKLKSALRGYGYVSLSSSDNKNVFSSFVLYINMVLHIDIMMFYGIDKRLARREDDIRNLYDILGSIEAALAVDSYRASLSSWCRPDFQDDYEIKDVYHPLIDNPVLNDVDVRRSMLITGANASGKSTFLRAVAASVIMAQTIHTVCAKEYRLPFLRVYSSMAISDSIQDGDSFFMAEVKSLKRIIDAANSEGDRVICFVDEILKGTNTIERIAASSQVTRHLIENNVLCVFASHDIELCSLLDEYVRNVHFEEADCKDKDDVYFTYKLMEGPTTGKNAIRLLGRLGVSAGLVDKAGAMAERFEKTKEWMLE